MNEFGVDIAFNTIMTAERVAAVDFGVFRIGTVGYGGIGTDAWYNKGLSIDGGFLTNLNNMLAAGKPRGCYIFSYAWDSASAMHEANLVCDFLDANNISLELPVFFDWEYDSYNRVTAAGVTVTPGLVGAMTETFMNVVRTRGRRTGWYANKDYCNQYYRDDLREYWRFSNPNNWNYIFWFAEWSGAAEPTLDCDLWQYAGDVPWMGIAQCDLNRVKNDRFFNGGTPSKIPVWLLAKISEENLRGYKSHVI